MRTMLKSKIHRVHVTGSNIDYEGSITIDKKLMEAADIIPFEQVQVLDVNNGARFTTYAIAGKEGEICINGAAARLASRGDIVIILTYTSVTEEESTNYCPTLVYVDTQNKITKIKSELSYAHG